MDYIRLGNILKEKKTDNLNIFISKLLIENNYIKKRY